MKECPKCGKKFNWWQRAVSEDKEHARHCCHSKKETDRLKLAATCRGCPAGCFEGVYNEQKKESGDDEK